MPVLERCIRAFTLPLAQPLQTGGYERRLPEATCWWTSGRRRGANDSPHARFPGLFSPRCPQKKKDTERTNDKVWGLYFSICFQLHHYIQVDNIRAVIRLIYFRAADNIDKLGS